MRGLFEDFIGEFLKFAFNAGSGGRNNFDDGGDIKLSPAKKGWNKIDTLFHDG